VPTIRSVGLASATADPRPGSPDEGATAVVVSAGVSFADSPPHADSDTIAAVAITDFHPTFMLVAEGLTKEFDSGSHHLTVLRDVSFTIPQGAFVAIVGPSGSGKTTLLGLLAGLDTPTRGRVLLDNGDLTAMTEDQRAQLRGQKVGFVFQSFQLIPTLDAQENVQVPLELRGESGAARRAKELLERVGLGDRLDHLPTQLSGGEQQRVAIARAFSNRPKILFADEPTGNLDGTTGARIVELLEELNRESHTTIVLVTHDLNLARRAQRLIRLADGLVVEDTGETGETGDGGRGTGESVSTPVRASSTV
jgi:putative ABC transport system ATP-binding protein